MTATQRTKQILKDTFPAMWLRWRFMKRPKTAERELNYLDKIVPAGAVTVDVGANVGLYTQKLAKLSGKVHAFEPSRDMATLLRRTSASNVSIHEIALSDQEGEADLYIPQSDDGLVHGLASLEQSHAPNTTNVVAAHVPLARLDGVMKDDVAFVKVDVEGHELSVLKGATGLIDRCQPVFLVEAEDRHRTDATKSIFEFFETKDYRGYFLSDDEIVPVDFFDAETMQDPDALLPNGGRKPGQSYVNNFFFFPRHLDGELLLSS
ncbi:FkbM family methyltransferase [Tardiphaga sp.]|jgi:FkbM family methyltransferase|uniref:FkbM family methyltransferase n=1 Tax=Tardiphaga sp. TaxID=1926292 RepID=UPI0037D9C6CC